MKCQLILNPRSNSGKAVKKFETIFTLLRQAGIEYDCSYARTYSSIHDASVKAQAGDHDVIVAIGGDGTINAVINSFFDEEGRLRSEKMMGVIYTGTSPDFCKSYGIPLDLDDAVETLRQKHFRKIRLGKIEFRKELHSSETETRYFSCCASIGIGAMVAGKANQLRKYLGDTAGTFAAILSSLVKFHPEDITIRTNHEEKIFSRVTNIFVGRTKYIASGLKFRDGIPDEDPRFYVICVRNLTLLRLPGLLMQMYGGHSANSSVLEVFFSDQLKINSGKAGIAVEFDGDPAGFSPCLIRLAENQLKLIVSGPSVVHY